MHKPTSKLGGTLAVLALVSATACMARAEEVSTALAAPSAASTDVSAEAPATKSPESAPRTRLRFERGLYKPGIETLSVVRRENTMNNVAGQVAISVVTTLLSGGVAIGGSGFSKNDLGGEPVVELANDPLAVHPAKSDLGEALSEVATRIYRERAEAARAEAREEGLSQEEIDKAGQLQAEADSPLRAGPWKLVYENLSGDDELFRLTMGAELGKPGFRRPPLTCTYASEPIAWNDWRANNWQKLREERALGVASCAKTLAAAPVERW